MNTAEYLRLVERDFGEMGQDEMIAWLDAYLGAQDVTPRLPRIGLEPLDDLLSLHRALPAKVQFRFNAALDQLLERAPIPYSSTDGNATTRLFLLVHLANVAKPPRARRILARYATIDHLFEVRYAEQRLHSAILNALCRYDVDQDTINLVWRISDPRRGFDYLVMCLRLLSYSMNGRAVYPLLDRIIPLLRTDAEARHLAGELTFVVRNLGMSELLLYLQHSQIVTERSTVVEYTRFLDALLRKVLPRHIRSLARLEADEPAAILLRLWLRSSDVTLTISDIKRIAEMSSAVVPREAVVRLLARLAAQTRPGDEIGFIWALDTGEEFYRRARVDTVAITDGRESVILHKRDDKYLVDILIAADEARESPEINAELLRLHSSSKFAALIGSEVGVN